MKKILFTLLGVFCLFKINAQNSPLTVNNLNGQGLLSIGSSIGYGAFLKMDRFMSSGNYFGLETGAGSNDDLRLYLNGSWSNPLMTFKPDGNIGIGTSAPTWKLHIKGAFTAEGDGLGNYPDLNLKNGNFRWHISAPRSNESNRLGIFWHDGTTYHDHFTITTDGNVGIGTSITNNYKLNVNGRVRANELVINTTGADFVFDNNYTLTPLQEVEAYILQYKHLSQIPSAAEMQANGMPVGELQTKFLQKIEELTLYLIDQNKKIAELEKIVKELKKHGE